MYLILISKNCNTDFKYIFNMEKLPSPKHLSLKSFVNIYAVVNVKAAFSCKLTAMCSNKLF